MIWRISVLPSLVLIALAGFAGIAQANFQYIPGDNGTSGSAAPMDNSPSVMASAPVARQPLMPTQSGGMQNHGDRSVIQGFGKQVPLVIALREIVPTSYQFAYADGVTLGTLVDWKGGRPWPDVMNSVLTPLGLAATEKSMVIYVDKQK